MPSAIWYPLQLDKIIHETEFTRRFIFRIESDSLFEYEAGQFLTCDLPIGEKEHNAGVVTALQTGIQEITKLNFAFPIRKGDRHLNTF